MPGPASSHRSCPAVGLVVALLAASPAVGRGQPRSSGEATAERAAAYMEARVRVGGFSGAVLVAVDGRPVLRDAYGLANHEGRLPNTTATKFRLGSLTKPFAAVAVLRLQERGALQVADPVGRYLRDWPEAWQAVTLHNLLTHTAGLPRLTTQALQDVSALSRSAATPFREIADLMRPGEELQPLDFQPGSEFAYSNVGYIALGMVVEKVSGKGLCEFLAQEIFRPLAMKDTACDDPGAIVEQRAGGYVRVEGALNNAPWVDVRLTGAAGALHSTVDDLLAFDRALATGRLLSPASQRLLWAPGKEGYACGWWVQTRYGRRVRWHGGNLPGFVAHLASFPDERLSVIVLSNVWSPADRGQVRAMANELAAIALGEDYELPRRRQRIELGAEALDAFVGTYRGKDTFAIVREDQRLLLQFSPGVSVFELYAESPLSFFAGHPEYFLTFTRDGTGRIAAVSIRNEGETGEWARLDH
jgi:CubicO group peptidase (beta-lactamase class C family)